MTSVSRSEADTAEIDPKGRRGDQCCGHDTEVVDCLRHLEFPFETSLLRPEPVGACFAAVMMYTEQLICPSPAAVDTAP